MDINSIKLIIDKEGIPQDIKEEMILSIIAKDENTIPYMLSVLGEEREQNKALIQDSNLELSRALLALQDPNVGKKRPKPYIELDFVINEIKKHYIKWQHNIRCCFKIKGLP